MTDVELREATTADRDGVRALCMKLDPADYVSAAWDEWRAQEGNLMLVARAGDRVVGCVRAGVAAPRQAFSQALRVDPAFRRCGVATRLMNEQAGRLRARGIDVARGVTSVANRRSRPFFATVGWNEIGVRRRRRLPGWTAGARSTATQDGLPDDLLASVEGRAHFRRVLLRADRPWLAAAARDGRWHAKDGAWALLDPPSRDHGAWVVALGGPPAALAELLRTLSPPWRVDGGLIVEAPDDPSVAHALDTLGFAPAPPEDAYVVVECPL
ncbi:hypothetical protein BURK1_00323 [Burkholderiales bacterium]|nr:hypothetical protein BURK1_00323 [Burkholderiales bacterium]